jgi:hypothetical protein
MAAYQAAIAGETAPRIEIGSTSRSKPGSVAAAVAAYFGSIDFGALAYATQRDRRRILKLSAMSTARNRSAVLRRGTSASCSPGKGRTLIRLGVFSKRCAA